jgi:hypothetical protein
VARGRRSAMGPRVRAATRLPTDRPFAAGLCESLTPLTLADAPCARPDDHRTICSTSIGGDHMVVRHRACIARLRRPCLPQSCQNELGSSHQTEANASPRAGGQISTLYHRRLSGHGTPFFFGVPLNDRVNSTRTKRFKRGCFLGERNGTTPGVVGL